MRQVLSIQSLHKNLDFMVKGQMTGLYTGKCVALDVTSMQYILLIECISFYCGLKENTKKSCDLNPIACYLQKTTLYWHAILWAKSVNQQRKSYITNHSADCYGLKLNKANMKPLLGTTKLFFTFCYLSTDFRWKFPYSLL